MQYPHYRSDKPTRKLPNSYQKRINNNNSNNDNNYSSPGGYNHNDNYSSHNQRKPPQSYKILSNNIRSPHYDSSPQRQRLSTNDMPSDEDRHAMINSSKNRSRSNERKKNHHSEQNIVQKNHSFKLNKQNYLKPNNHSLKNNNTVHHSDDYNDDADRDNQEKSLMEIKTQKKIIQQKQIEARNQYIKNQTKAYVKNNISNSGHVHGKYGHLKNGSPIAPWDTDARDHYRQPEPYFPNLDYNNPHRPGNMANYQQNNHGSSDIVSQFESHFSNSGHPPKQLTPIAHSQNYFENGQDGPSPKNNLLRPWIYQSNIHSGKK